MLFVVTLCLDLLSSFFIFLKVSHSKKKIRNNFFLVLLFVKLRQVMSETILVFFGVFVDAEKIVFVENVLLNFLHIFTRVICLRWLSII